MTSILCTVTVIWFTVIWFFDHLNEDANPWISLDPQQNGTPGRSDR
jgi:hypothetical protein